MTEIDIKKVSQSGNHRLTKKKKSTHIRCITHKRPVYKSISKNKIKKNIKLKRNSKTNEQQEHWVLVRGQNGMTDTTDKKKYRFDGYEDKCQNKKINNERVNCILVSALCVRERPTKMKEQ